MHLGNVFTAVLSWLSVRSCGGRWILRIEDLDPQRSRREYAVQIEDDLRWLGLGWDEGGTEGSGPHGPYMQSGRHAVYEAFLERLRATGYVYPCRCTRADIMATQAPHASDGRVLYPGLCRPARLPLPAGERRVAPYPHAERLYVPDREIVYDDAVCGRQCVNLAREVGDFVLRRADGAWGYQLAVVIDDAMMGVTEVMRGNDLLVSAAQQIYLYELGGYVAPRYAHLPLICNAAGQRLSKRDASLSMAVLRGRYTPEQLLGHVGYLAGLLEAPRAVTLPALLDAYAPGRLTRVATVCVTSELERI